MLESFKSCRQCRFFEEINYSERCTHYKAVIKFEPVSGKTEYERCRVARSSERICGIDAFLFEPKLTKFQKFDAAFDEFFDKLIIKIKRLL